MIESERKTLQEIACDALREMYSEAEPPLDFDDVLENPDEYDDGWYEDHYLDSDRQWKTVDKHCDKHDLQSKERTAIHFTALELGPTGAKELVNE